MPGPIQIPITSPVHGVNRVVAREGQSPEQCWDALNVLPFDRYGRHRVAQRPGLAKLYPTQLASTFIQGMIQIPGTANVSTAVPFYSENFANLAEFNANWSGLPAGWTVGSGGIAVPTSNVPVSSTKPLFNITPLSSAFGPGGYQFVVGITITAAGYNGVSGLGVVAGLGPSTVTYGTFAANSPAYMTVVASASSQWPNFPGGSYSGVIGSFGNNASSGAQGGNQFYPSTLPYTFTATLTINKNSVSNCTISDNAGAHSDTGVQVDPAACAGKVFWIFASMPSPYAASVG